MEDRSSKRKFLSPSELGNKDYWETIYARELDNHSHDADDEGTIWFDESNAEEAILNILAELDEKQLVKRSPESIKTSETKAGDPRRTTMELNTKSPTRFLDLGTGNGHLLFSLRQDDDDGLSWSGDLVGVDYSESSIKLARRLLEQKQLQNIRFEMWNLLTDNPGTWLSGGFDVVLDKGTFDAISLMPPPANGSPHPCEIYRERVTALIKPDHFLCITSCNWTKAELVEWLTGEHGGLELFTEAKYPTYTFGGRTGQTIVTLVFRRGSNSISSREKSGPGPTGV